MKFLYLSLLQSREPFEMRAESYICVNARAHQLKTYSISICDILRIVFFHSSIMFPEKLYKKNEQQQRDRYSEQ